MDFIPFLPLNTVASSEVGLVNVTNEAGMYKVTVEAQGQDIPVYVTPDGKYYTLTLSPISQEVSTTSSDTAVQENIPQTAKPKVELYVMSFCPYGVKAENNILPVLDLLKDKIDFKVRFIVNVNGNTINDTSSLHGLEEAKEDARQLIIMKDYASKFNDYLKQFNEKCYQYSQDAANLDKCWKEVATSLGMNVKSIETAAYGTEGVNLLKEEASASGSNGISGSPTLLINGVQSSSIYSGTDATQQAICSAFNSAPSECGTKVASNSTTDAPAGSCG